MPFGCFELVACNPPYKSDGSGIKNPDGEKLLARHEESCTIDDVTEAARNLLQFGGRFVMCQRPERLTDVLGSMRKNDLEPKRLRFVQQREGKAPKLYVVGTPIGNLSDMSPRAVETLGEVDFIAAEDTRVTLKLLNRFDIKKPLVSYYEHNKRERGEVICERILAGESCAIVTDAGMPCISDPGEDLIKLCEQKGIPTVVVPGPSAVVSALAVSGLDTGRFCFEGFLSVNKKSRKEHLESLKNESRTMIFYEAPHKLPNTLRDLYEFFGERKLSIVREITKIHEEVIRTDTKYAAEVLADSGIKGEIVLVLEGKTAEKDEKFTLAQAVELAEKLIAEGSKVSDAAKEAAAATGFKKHEIYKELI